MQNANILVCGAGIAGPTLCYWLLARGFSPTLIERAPAPRKGGYLIDFWGAGFEVAGRMKLLPELYRDGYRMEEVRLVDESGKRVAGFDAQLFRKATGNKFVSLLRSDLAHRIYDLVDGQVEAIFSDTITGLDEDATGVNVTFERSRPRRFDLVIGAGGIHSIVRELHFGNPTRYETFLGYYTAAFSVDDYPHRDENVYVSHSAPGRSIARYALRDGRSVFFFIFSENTILPVGYRDIAAQKTIVRERFSDIGWETPEILAALDRADDFYFDTVSQTVMNDWSRGRVALVGDAAYCPSLLAGEGAGLAMAGAFILANSLSLSAGDHRRAFNEYQKSLKSIVDRKQRSARRYASWFAPRSRAGVWLRNAITNLMGVPYLGDFLVSRSFGASFRLPALVPLPVTDPLHEQSSSTRQV